MGIRIDSMPPMVTILPPDPHTAANIVSLSKVLIEPLALVGFLRKPVGSSTTPVAWIRRVRQLKWLLIFKVINS